MHAQPRVLEESVNKVLYGDLLTEGNSPSFQVNKYAKMLSDRALEATKIARSIEMVAKVKIKDVAFVNNAMTKVMFKPMSSIAVSKELESQVRKIFMNHDVRFAGMDNTGIWMTMK